MVINCIMRTSKILKDLCFTKQRIKTKNICLQCFSSKNVLKKHKEVCLSINRAQSVRLEKGTIEFKLISNKYQFHWKFILILSVI